jgi:glutaredoxin
VYSSTRCGDCREAKRFLDQHGIAYETVEIDHDPAAAAELEQRTGKRGVPTFVLDSERWVRAYVPRQGFDRVGMTELLGLA